MGSELGKMSRQLDPNIFNVKHLFDPSSTRLSMISALKSGKNGPQSSDPPRSNLTILLPISSTNSELYNLVALDSSQATPNLSISPFFKY